MIGIYKIQNKQNGKIYIGQSNDIERRIKEHCYPNRYKKSRCLIDYAIHKYGVENFTYETVEECSLEELNDREQYWIQYYDSRKKGYNCSDGGNQQSVGSNNGRAKITEDDVRYIRSAYNNHARKKDVYEKFKDKLTWNGFSSVWEGTCWRHIMPEVFTEENRNYYIYGNSRGEKGACAMFTNEEVLEYRKRYQNETAREMYPEVKDRVTYQTFQRILCGIDDSYADVPVFGKAKKETLTDEEVKESREYYITHSARQTFNHFDYAKKLPFSTFKQMLEGLRYNHIPWYSKKYKKWNVPESTCTDYPLGRKAGE